LDCGGTTPLWFRAWLAPAALEFTLMLHKIIAPIPCFNCNKKLSLNFGRSAGNHLQGPFDGREFAAVPLFGQLQMAFCGPIIVTAAFTVALALPRVQEKRGHVPAVQGRAAPWTAAARRRFCFTTRKRRTLLNVQYLQGLV